MNTVSTFQPLKLYHYRACRDLPFYGGLTARLIVYNQQSNCTAASLEIFSLAMQKIGPYRAPKILEQGKQFGFPEKRMAFIYIDS